jgi:FKBP-type peptidyl-prolyl cis-trans isomerase FklB
MIRATVANASTVVLIALLLALLTPSSVVEARRRRGHHMGLPGEEEEPPSEADIRREKYFKRVHNKFMNDVFLLPNIVKLKSGVMFEILKSSPDILEQYAKSPRLEDKCTVSYVSSTRNGTVFENDTKDRKPEEVIEGWKQAMQLMAEGDRWKLYLPYTAAFGEDGIPGKIEPFSPLV